MHYRCKHVLEGSRMVKYWLCIPFLVRKILPHVKYVFQLHMAGYVILEHSKEKAKQLPWSFPAAKHPSRYTWWLWQARQVADSPDWPLIHLLRPSSSSYYISNTHSAFHHRHQFSLNLFIKEEKQNEKTFLISSLDYQNFR